MASYHPHPLYTPGETHPRPLYTPHEISPVVRTVKAKEDQIRQALIHVPTFEPPNLDLLIDYDLLLDDVQTQVRTFTHLRDLLIERDRLKSQATNMHILSSDRLLHTYDDRRLRPWLYSPHGGEWASN